MAGRFPDASAVAPGRQSLVTGAGVELESERGVSPSSVTGPRATAERGGEVRVWSPRARGCAGLGLSRTWATSSPPAALAPAAPADILAVAFPGGPEQSRDVLRRPRGPGAQGTGHSGGTETCQTGPGVHSVQPVGWASPTAGSSGARDEPQNPESPSQRPQDSLFVRNSIT